jgi:tetratricopeptide (TPR) repeat protein
VTDSRCSGEAPRGGETPHTTNRFSAQSQYAESILQSAVGDMEASIRALEDALDLDPGYAPAILSMGSVEYQRRNRDRGKQLFLSLVSLPPDSTDDGETGLAEIIDAAGDFLIQTDDYADGLDLYRAAVARFPACAVLYMGMGCCAGHEGHHDEAIAASETALELDPDNQKCVNDLGWSLFEAGRLEKAHRFLDRAVTMDPTDALAAENLRRCLAAISKAAG